MEIGTGGWRPAKSSTSDFLARVLARARRGAVPALVVLALSGACFIALAPLAHSIAKGHLRELGWNFDARRTRVRFFAVRFDDVTLSSAELPDVVLALDHVSVELGVSLAPRRVDVHGGFARISGPLSKLRREFESFRGKSGRSASSASGTRFPVLVDGVGLAYTGESTGESARIWGARYERRGDGSEIVGADLARFAGSAVIAETVDARAAITRDHDLRRLASVSARRLSATLNLDDDAPATPAPPSGGTPATAGTPRRTRSAKPAAPVGPAVSSTPTEDTPIDGPELRETLRRLANDASSALNASGKVELAGATFAVRHGGESLNFGPANLSLVRDADRLRLTVAPAAEGANAPLRFDLTVPLGSGAVDAALAGGPVSLAAIGVKEGDMGLRDVDRAELDVDGRANWSDDGRSLSLSGRSELTNLSLFQPKLASDVVRDLRVALSGEASFELDGSRVDVKDVELGVGRVKVHTSAHLERSDGSARGNLHAEVPLAACADVLASTPPGLVPLLAGLETTGTFAFSGDLVFDTRRPDATRVESHIENECRISRVPEAISPARFLQTWVRTVPDGRGGTVTIESGPGSAGWTPLTDISPFVPIAVVVCEDSRFWYHGGFDEKAIHDSIRDNLKAGSFVRGASTVSMQLAKNLFLGREKTLSRKLQEAVLTLLLEQALTKEQILELYLNVIEFSPGLYGIGPAAQYYFHTTPHELSLAQSLYLISVLPNPKNQHFDRKGALTETWSAYLRHLMEIAHKIRKIDDRQLELGTAEAVHFGVPAADEATGEQSADPVLGDPDKGYAPDAEGP